MTNIPDLIARLEKAEEGSRELDQAIWESLGGSVRNVREKGGHVHQRWFSSNAGGARTRYSVELTMLTTSLDAITALIDEMLPFGHRMVEWDSSEAYAMVGKASSNSVSTPPLALCIALLRALKAKDS